MILAPYIEIQGFDVVNFETPLISYFASSEKVLVPGRQYNNTSSLNIQQIWLYKSNQASIFSHLYKEYHIIVFITLISPVIQNFDQTLDAWIPAPWLFLFVNPPL